MVKLRGAFKTRSDDSVPPNKVRNAFHPAQLNVESRHVVASMYGKARESDSLRLCEEFDGVERGEEENGVFQHRLQATGSEKSWLNSNVRRNDVSSHLHRPASFSHPPFPLSPSTLVSEWALGSLSSFHLFFPRCSMYRVFEFNLMTIALKTQVI